MDEQTPVSLPNQVPDPAIIPPDQVADAMGKPPVLDSVSHPEPLLQPIARPAAAVDTPPSAVVTANSLATPITTPAPDGVTNGQDGSGGALHNIMSAISAGFLFILNWLIIPAAIVFILHFFVFQAFHVVGSSMVPTLHDADYIIVSKVDKTISGIEHKSYLPHRYDVVVFHYPKDPSLVFVKRAIGLPGERVVVKDGHVTIYNQANPSGFSPDVETYTRAANTTLGNFDDTVPAGQIFVLGDNRTPNGSFDSRDWGFLPSSYIVGNAVIRLLPIDQFKIFSDLQLVFRYI